MGNVIPTPSGNWLVGNLMELQRDPLALFERALAEHGDVVRIRFGPANAVLISHPDHIEHVLVANASNYAIDHATQKAGKIILGDALVLSDGDFGKTHRRIINPVFHKQKINGFASAMVEAALRLERRWQERTRPGEPLDITVEMSRLTIDIVGHTLFGETIDGHAESIIAAEESAARDVLGKLRMPFQAPPYLPTPANLRLKKARRTFDDLFRPAVERSHVASRTRRPWSECW